MPLGITTTLTRMPLPIKRGASLFARAKKLVLGDAYDLSLVAIGEKKSKTLNTTYREKQKPTNVLAFPVTENTGEIYLTFPLLTREAHLFGLTPNEHALYLFVHGCLHLKGYDHGDAMERAEKNILKQLHAPHPDTN